MCVCVDMNEGLEEGLVSSRLPMFVFVMLLSTLMHSLAQLGCLLHMLVHEQVVTSARKCMHAHICA